MQSQLGFALLVLLAKGASSDDDKESHDDHHGFNYADAGKWSDAFPTCGGKRQSPIDIDHQYLDKNEPNLPKIKWSGYDKQPLKMIITNSGHSVQLTGSWPPGETPSVSGGPLSGGYKFAQLHFHWGPTDDTGSEHTFEGASSSLEMHIIHWKEEYGSVSEAMGHEDGLVVIAYLISSFGWELDIGVEKMQTGFENILKPGQQVEIKPFPLSDFGLRPDGPYVTYMGSLTTPPCTESVIWLVSTDPKLVSREQINSFRKLSLNHNDAYNTRPTQPMNNRSLKLISQ